MTDKPESERRSETRTKSLVKRTIPATLSDESYGTMYNHLYLVDLSTKRLRVNLDRTVEPESELQISLPLPSLGHSFEGLLELNCRVVWSRPLAGGTCVLGLEFLELPKTKREIIESILEHWDEKQGLEFEQLPSPVDGKIRELTENSNYRPLSVRFLSKQGIRFPSKLPWEIGQELETRLLLEAGTVQTTLRVRWCEPAPNGLYDVACEFQELNSGQASYIDLHLKRCRHRPIV